jgi:neurotransmitter:Na+ symporter, NSS family
VPEREQWGSRAGFILAAVGSAIGLGNIWRFPYVAYDSGGGAFIVPYLVALLTAGIPLLVLEYSIGHRFRGSAPLAFRGLSRRTEFVGWWQIGIAFVISTYYAVIIAWAAAYAVFSVGLQWGGDPDGFLFGQYLRVGDEPGEIGGLVAGVAVPLVLVWAVTLAVLAAGVRKGIEVANKIFIPTLVAVFLLLVLRAVTLDGAIAGLEALFRPDWGAITDGSVWVAAYGQIFFSLSIAFAIMITYASYLPRRSDLTNNAFIAGFGNASFELLAGIGVFSVLGFMAATRDVPVEAVATEGVGLAFVTFPEIINTLPALNQTFGVLFFGALVLAGLSSLISVVQTYVAGVQEKFAVGRVPAVLVGGGAAAVLSLLFATEGGLYLLDVADYFINHFGIAVAGLVEVVVIAWLLRRLGSQQAHANAVSDIRLGLWWKVVLAVVTPLLLGWMTVDNLVTVFTDGYEDYPLAFLVTAGWSVAGAALLAGIALALPGWRDARLVAAAEAAGKEDRR